MAVSAVVVGKDEPNLERCLRSLRDQEERVEIVYVDGGSSPEHLEVAKSLADRVLVGGKGIGLDRARGIREAKHDLVLSCDGDSIYPPNHSSVAQLILSKDHACYGPVYPLEPSPLGNLESNLTRNPEIWPWVYENNCALRKSTFLGLMLDQSPYLALRRGDIGPLLAPLAPKWRGDFYNFTRLPTALFRHLCWGLDMLRVYLDGSLKLTSTFLRGLSK
jgi:glycosyltransferase involved in cell wall biosynthesis